MQIRCKEVTVLMPWPCLSKILAVKICVLAAVKTHKEGCFACAHRHLVAVNIFSGGSQDAQGRLLCSLNFVFAAQQWGYCKECLQVIRAYVFLGLSFFSTLGTRQHECGGIRGMQKTMKEPAYGPFELQ